MDMHFDGVIFQTHAAELSRRMRHSHPPFAILDLRDDDAFAAGRIPGAVQATVAALERALPPGTTPGTEFFLVGSGPTDRAVRAASLALQRHGVRRRVEFPGGMHEWRDSGLPVASGESAAA